MLPIRARGVPKEAPEVEAPPKVRTPSPELNPGADAAAEHELPSSGLPPMVSKSGNVPLGLPIAGRGAGLPIAARGVDPPAYAAARAPDVPAPLGLPIAGRGMGLPIAARGVEASRASLLTGSPAGVDMPLSWGRPQTPTDGLPIAARGADAPGPPIASHTASTADSTSQGLPIAPRGGGLPIAARGEAGTDTAYGTRRPSRSARSASISSQKSSDIRLRRQLAAMPSHRLLVDDYDLGEVLGEGAFSIVYACYPRNSEGDFAVKMVDKVESPMEDIKREVNILQTLKHRNIVNQVEVFWEKCFVCIVLDRHRGGDLFVGMQLQWDIRGSIPCGKVMHIQRQILDAVRFLHQQRVVHRDVKGDNYLLDREDILDVDCSVTLTDFGTACRLEPDTRLSEEVGTRTYWAPEFFKKDYGFKVDDWACGIVICGLLTQAFPFNNDQAVRDPDRPAKIAVNLPPLCLDLIMKLLAKEEDKRMTSTEATEHPWVKGLKRDPAKYNSAPADLFGTRAPQEVSKGAAGSTSEPLDAASYASYPALDFAESRPLSPRVPATITKSHFATRESGPDVGVHERRIELFERVFQHQAVRRASAGDDELEHRGRGMSMPFACPLSTLRQPRFIVEHKHEKKQFGYEWFPVEKARACVTTFEMERKTPGLVLKQGDCVRVIRGQDKDTTGLVLQPSWHGLVKVRIDLDGAKEVVRGYKLSYLELIPVPGQEPLLKEGDLVRILKEGSMKGHLAVVSGPPSAGLVEVRMEDPNSEESDERYNPGDLEVFVRSYSSEGSATSEESMSPQRSGGTPAEMHRQDVSVQVVGQMLEHHGIDTTVFGTGQAKSLIQFAKEVRSGSSQLMLDAAEHRTLVRVVHVVLLRICLENEDDDEFRCRYLVECGETFPDGRERSFSRLPGSKKEPHENTRKVAERVRDEMLNMTDCQIDFDFEHGTEEFEEDEMSVSYPGVRTVYRKTIVEGWLTSDDPENLKRMGSEGGKWSFEDSRGNTKHFEWLNEDECEDNETLICAPDFVQEISCLVKAPLGFSEEKLLDFLSSNGIDPASFGTRPGSKTLKDLAEETKRGETSFLIEPDGRVLRVVDVVILKISRNGGKEVLVQADEAFKSSPHDRTVLNRLLGQKLGPADNQFVVSYACLKKMLNIDENSVNMNPDKVELIESVQLSHSYPGLLTLYRHHIISGEVLLDSTPPELLRKMSV